MKLTLDRNEIMEALKAAFETKCLDTFTINADKIQIVIDAGDNPTDEESSRDSHEINAWVEID